MAPNLGSKKPMRGTWILVCTGLLATQSAAGQEASARTALDQAFTRQRAQASYTEHTFGRMPAVPGAFGAAQNFLSDQLKDRAFQAAQDEIATSTSKLPIAGDELSRALAKAQADGSAPDLAIVMGPEKPR